MDATVASGIRTIRYAKAFENNENVKLVGCDLSEKAVETFQKNIRLNGYEKSIQARCCNSIKYFIIFAIDLI